MWQSVHQIYIKRPLLLSLIALTIIQLIFLGPLFHSGMYETHDGENNVARFAAYYTSIVDGQFPPRWAGNLNYSYGSPLFIFFYPLPGYIATCIHLLHISFQNSYKLLLAISFVLTPIFSYLWLTRMVKNKLASFAGSLFLGLAPYQFLNFYVRGDIGEMLAISFLMLFLWQIETYIESPTGRKFCFACINIAFIVLSHNGVSLMFLPFIVAYLIMRSVHHSNLLKDMMFMVVLGLGISSFFWLPALIESKYTMASFLIGSMFTQQFPTVLQLIWSPWGFGADVQKVGGLSPQIGLLHILIVLSAIPLIHRHRYPTIALLFLGMFFLGVFLSTPASTFIWMHIALLRKYEFPWRFVALPTVASSFLISYALSKAKNKMIFICIATVLVFSFTYHPITRYTNRSDHYFLTYPGTTFYHGEATTIWSSGDPGAYPKSKIEIIDGDAVINSYSHTSSKISFNVIATNASKILVNTFYFPGWTALVGGNKTPIEFQDMNHRGLITFTVPQGSSNVIVRFNESPIRKISDMISVFSLCVLLSISIIYFQRKMS